MKHITLILFLFSSVVYASESTLKPNISVDCKTYSGNIDLVYNSKASTDGDKVTVSFLTSFGECLNGERVIKEMPQDFEIAFWNPGVNYPWSQFIGDVEIIDFTNLAKKVVVEFNEKDLFSGYNEKTFTFVIYHHTDNYAPTRKSWILKLKKLTTDKIQLSIR